jgi:hypothetical protein
MKISRYNPVNMNLISGDITGIDFGSIRLGTFCNQTVVIKPVAESENLTSIGLYLEDRGNLNHTRFGLYKSQTATPGINPGDARLNTFLQEAPGVSDYNQFTGYRVTLTPGNPEYAWLDAKPGTNETAFGASALNFRFVFEYN